MSRRARWWIGATIAALLGTIAIVAFDAIPTPRQTDLKRGRAPASVIVTSPPDMPDWILRGIIEDYRQQLRAEERARGSK